MNEKQLKLKIEKIDPNAVIPTRGTNDSAGLDLTAIGFDLKDNGSQGIVIFKTGLKVEIPQNYWGGIYIRSGIASKGLWTLANSAGVIDSDYRGPLMVMMRYVGADRFLTKQINFTHRIKELIGTKIAQLIIQPYQQVIIKSVKSVNETERGAGGFGHTGK